MGDRDASAREEILNWLASALERDAMDELGYSPRPSERLGKIARDRAASLLDQFENEIWDHRLESALKRRNSASWHDAIIQSAVGSIVALVLLGFAALAITGFKVNPFDIFRKQPDSEQSN